MKLMIMQTKPRHLAIRMAALMAFLLAGCEGRLSRQPYDGLLVADGSHDAGLSDELPDDAGLSHEDPDDSGTPADAQQALDLGSTADEQDTQGADTQQQKLATYFRADSLWNTPIANEPVAWHDVPAMRSNCWWINYEGYANPVVFGAPSDPLVDVTVPDSWGWPAGVVQVHVPAGVTGAVGTDGSIVIVSGTKTYDFWQFDRTSNTTATVSAWAQNDIVTGTGWGSHSPFKAAGIRAGGSSGLAGQIMGDELQTGIHHALAIASTPAAGLDGPALPPAISSDGPAEGLRVGIPPGTSKPAGLSVQGSNVWDALATYGAWLADRIGGTCVIAFNADPRSVPEADVNALFGDLDTIKTHVRVIDFDYHYNP